MRSLTFLIPGRLQEPTGGYVYDRRIIEGLRGHGWAVEVRTLDASFPYPTPAALDHAAEVLSALPSGSRVLVDGLAFGAMPEIIERQKRRLRVAALVHLPLAADVSLDAAMRRRLFAAERRALRAAALVIVTGRATRTLLTEYSIAPEKLVVVEPGTARVPNTRRVQTATLTLLCVATLQPGKGHEILLEALAPLRRLDWQLVCAGSLTRHPQTTNRVRAAVTRLELDTRVTLLGELDERGLCHCYHSADVFVLATRQETYGMAVAEALAHSLPVVATTTGAIPDLVGNEAGLLVAPGDTAALSAALERVISDAALRAWFTMGAERASHRLPTWDEASRHMADALTRLDAHE